jgi:adenylate kinase family enzyme
MSQKTFIFIGRSGCGKGIQAKLLSEYLKEKTPNVPIFYLETGQTFRDLISRGSFTSNLAKEINEVGGLQPEFLAVWAWSHLLVENLRGDEHLIIDGTPRKLQEALVLDSALKFYKRYKSNIVYINVSKEGSRERLLSRKRADDTEDDIEKRLAWFETDVVPAIEVFRNNDDYNFIEIKGERTIQEIHKELIEKIS